MDPSELQLALKSILIDLDESSVKVLNNVVNVQNIVIVKIGDKYYLKKMKCLIELDCILKMMNDQNYRPPVKSQKIISLVNTIKTLQNIEKDGKQSLTSTKESKKVIKCANNDNGISFSSEDHKNLLIRYLFEKVKLLELKNNKEKA